MEKIITPTFYCHIYMGLKIGYNGKKIEKKEISSYLKLFTDNNKISISTTDVNFYYSNTLEKGICIKLINIPHYNLEDKDIMEFSEAIIDDLFEIFDQEKIIAVYPEETITFRREK